MPDPSLKTSISTPNNQAVKVPAAFNQRQIVDNYDVQKAMLAVCMREAGILSCVVNVTNANIEITILRTDDNETFHKALESIIGNYAWFADKSTYNGDLRIILDNNQGKMIDERNTTASDAIAHVQDETIGTGWVESVINASRDVKAITFGREKVLSGDNISIPTNGVATMSGSGTSSYSNPCDKTVYVQGYYRKDGTYVAPYYRKAPGCG